ncbi:MAG: hypothetical protein WAN11_03550 [Syntrophobacteraceae bacterium]
MPRELQDDVLHIAQESSLIALAGEMHSVAIHTITRLGSGNVYGLLDALGEKK